MAMPAATAALMLRVDPNWAIDTVNAAPARASSVMPGPSWPNSSRQSRGSVVCSSRAAPGHVVDGDHRQARSGGEAQQLGGGVVVAQPLVAVGDHGAAAIPAAPADDVDGVDGERVGGAHHPADVGVVAEVLDRHMQRVSALVDVGDDRLTRPVPVGVDDVAGVAVAQQRRVVPRVVGQRPRPGPTPPPERPTRWDRVRSLHGPDRRVGAHDRDGRVQQRLVDVALGAQRGADVTASSDASGRTSTDDP